MKDYYGIIYKRTNLINNKIYIGQTIGEPDTRWCAEDRSSQLIGKKVREYGKENFKNEVIDFANSKEELNEKEKYWIKYYNSSDSNFGYNRTKGGNGGSKPSNCCGKIIVWLDKKLIFRNEKSLIEYIMQLTSLTYAQSKRLINIGLRLEDYQIENTDIILNLKLLKDCPKGKVNTFNYFN